MNGRFASNTSLLVFNFDVLTIFWFKMAPQVMS